MANATTTTSPKKTTKKIRKRRKGPACITRSDLAARDGWSRTVIDKLLIVPDDFAINPHHRSGNNLVCLYYLRRVKRVEKTKAFQQQFEMTMKRKSAALKGAATQRLNLLWKH